MARMHDKTPYTKGGDAMFGGKTKIDYSEKAGSNMYHKPVPEVKEGYDNDIGITAGYPWMSGDVDAIGSDRGFHAPRDGQYGYNPQNMHEKINPEYTRDVAYGGQVKFPNEP